MVRGNSDERATSQESGCTDEDFTLAIVYPRVHWSTLLLTPTD